MPNWCAITRHNFPAVICGTPGNVWYRIEPSSSSGTATFTKASDDDESTGLTLPNEEQYDPSSYKQKQKKKVILNTHLFQIL